RRPLEFAAGAFDVGGLSWPGGPDSSATRILYALPQEQVNIAEGALPADPIWRGTSCQDRFGIFCERLVVEQLYDAACYVTSSAEDPKPVELVQGLTGGTSRLP
ncbi:PaeR7I family type II restriction endonuclease, partial [Streptomyces sp. ADI98-10]|uniref:PaeR7I family type II restriction endonuclease n=1 Tax=Streptomyces sp. ADI98-10 TaxID=1522763 RepID=UPI001F156AD7